MLRHRECHRQPGGTADRRFACGLQFRGKKRSAVSHCKTGSILTRFRHMDVSPPPLFDLFAFMDIRDCFCNECGRYAQMWAICRRALSGKVRKADESDERPDSNKSV